MKPRVAIYVRVSTQEQSCDLQRAELLAYAHARGWTVCEVFEDRATGTNANRPMLKLLLQAVRTRKVDVVAVWKLDRFARSLKDLVVMIQDFSELGVPLVSLRDNVDLSTTSGKLMLHLIGAFAEFEASLIQERTRAGLLNAKARGVRLGRPRLDREGEIRALRKTGKTYREIEAELGVSMGTIHRALANAEFKVGSAPCSKNPSGSAKQTSNKTRSRS